jgi:signal transduction histidine kinase
MSLFFGLAPRQPGLHRTLWWIRPAGVGVLAGLVAVHQPRPELHGRGLLVLLALIGTVGSWAAEFVLERRRAQASLVCQVGAAVCGSLLALASPNSSATAFPLIAAGVGSATLPAVAAAAVVGGTALTLVIGLAAIGHTRDLLWLTPVIGLVALAGAVRRSYVQRAEQAELLLAQAERARVAEAGRVALAERTRIARDLHDVLAHSIAALAMQLEAADALLADGQVDRAHQIVLRARDLARDGLVETRHAVQALREDYQPLPAALRRLGEPVEITGPSRELPPDTHDAIFRAAQEALTNARKHAPGGKILVELAFEPELVRLQITNDGATEPAALTHTGAGLGLVGMRERAAAVGGAVEAGPAAGGWSVTVTIPT